MRVTNIAHADEGQTWRRNPMEFGEMQWLETRDKFAGSGFSQILL